MTYNEMKLSDQLDIILDTYDVYDRLDEDETLTNFKEDIINLFESDLAQQIKTELGND